MSDSPLAIATCFAAALDAEDYASARALLAEGCVYEIGTDRLVGPDAILASYQGNGDQAKVRFKEVEYESAAEATGPRSAAITFTDHLRFGSARHTFRCRQHVRVGDGGRIEEIRHEELPGERERLREFEDRGRERGG